MSFDWKYPLYFIEVTLTSLFVFFCFLHYKYIKELFVIVWQCKDTTYFWNYQTFFVKNCKFQENFVIPMRLERMTYCLEGSCSIQLSYGTIMFVPLEGVEPSRNFRCNSSLDCPLYQFGYNGILICGPGRTRTAVCSRKLSIFYMLSSILIFIMQHDLNHQIAFLSF